MLTGGAAAILPVAAVAVPGAAVGSSASGPMLTDLKGQTAVVTGSSRGIGKGIAVGLGEAGATVFVTGRERSREALEATAALVTEVGGRGVALVCDHKDDSQVAAAFEEVGKQTGGTLNLLVNNAFQDPTAGKPELDALFQRKAKFYELPLSVWDDMHNVGLRSHYVSSYYAAPLLRAAAKEPAAASRPLILTTSSFGGVAYLFTAAYGVEKAGSDRLMRDLQVELEPDNIDCISLWPGFVLTEKIEELIRSGSDRIADIVGGQDPHRVGESPLLSGRVVARLAAEGRARQPPYTLQTGLLGRVCIVAEAAQDLGIRDGATPGTLLADIWGADRAAAPSIRSLGFLGPGPLRSNLPEGLRWLADPGGPLASDAVRLPLDFMAQGPPPRRAEA